MIDPKTITTSGVRTDAVLENTGDGGFTVAKVRMPHGGVQLGIRWNGEAGVPSKANGYPTARGYPVWFYFPEELTDVIVNHYRNNSQPI
jgi:hypothetical protein